MNRLPWILCLLLPALLLLSSCGSSGGRKGLPKKLPQISLYGSPATPAHNLAPHDYPFDASGNYVTSWASQGGQPAANSSDYDSWQRSHDGNISKRAPKRESTSRRSSSSKRSSSAKTSKSGRSSSKSSSKSSKSSKSSSSAKSSSRSYTVKKGDTLSTIARRNGTTVSKLKAANGIQSDSIRPGRNLKVPKK